MVISMRIIAGTARSLPLKTVEGLDTRPTTDRIKETLFNIIQDEIPGCYFLDLFAGRNDYDAVKKAGAGGHKEINRTNLKKEEIQELLQKDVVKKQLMLLKFRNSCKAFGNGASMKIKSEKNLLEITWENAGEKAVLSANVENYQFEINYEK